MNERIEQLRAEQEDRRQRRAFPHEPGDLNREADEALTEALRGWESADRFYEAFLAEMDKVTIKADMPAAAVVGECTRAAKRAQMAVSAVRSEHEKESEGQSGA